MKTISVIGSAPILLGKPGVGKAWKLLEILEKSGYKLTNDLSGDFVLAIDHNQVIMKKLISEESFQRPKCLLRLEPTSVFPSQYSKRVEAQYGLILTPGQVDTKGISLTKYGWPYQYHYDPVTPSPQDPQLSDKLQFLSPEADKLLDTWQNRPIKVSLIAGNKVTPTREKNYSLRRKIAKETSPTILEVYGPLWTDNLFVKLRHRLAVAYFALRQGQIPSARSIYGDLFAKYKTTKGFVANKHSILEKSKFALTIENSNSYASEKIFDALINGSIPIYVGPKLESLGLPQDIAIEADLFSTGLIEILSNLDEPKIHSLLNAGNSFLKTSDFKSKWTAESVYEEIGLEIMHFFEQK